MGCSGVLMGMLGCWDLRESWETTKEALRHDQIALPSPYSSILPQHASIPLFSSPQCCPPLTLQKATGPIQILDHLLYFSLRDSTRKCPLTVLKVHAAVNCVLRVLQIFLCMYPEKQDRGVWGICLYRTCLPVCLALFKNCTTRRKSSGGLSGRCISSHAVYVRVWEYMLCFPTESHCFSCPNIAIL